MSTIEETVEVGVTAQAAYDRWYEQFPTFLEGGSPTGDAGSDARIVDQEPGRRIAWRSQASPRNGGSAAFEPIGDASARVRVVVDDDSSQDDALARRRVLRARRLLGRRARRHPLAPDDPGADPGDRRGAGGRRADGRRRRPQAAALGRLTRHPLTRSQGGRPVTPSG